MKFNKNQNKMGKQNGRGNCDNFEYPSDEKRIKPYPFTGTLVSPLDEVLNSLKTRVYLRWYPGNRSYKPYLLVANIPSGFRYGVNPDGSNWIYQMDDLIYRIRISQIGGSFVHEGCFSPDTNGGVNYRGIQANKFPDGRFKAEFIDYLGNPYNVDPIEFNKPSF